MLLDVWLVSVVAKDKVISTVVVDGAVVAFDY